jgi:hypothetical protein
MIDLVGDATACGPDCPAFIDKWTSWWAEKTTHEVAMLDCRAGPGEYAHILGAKGRNMVRKADRLYEFRPFKFNTWLMHVEEINRSKPVRQGIPMQGWYTEPIKAQVPLKLCGLHSDLWVGGFERDGGRLRGYAHVEVLNDLAIINSILGHAEAPAVVNGLIAHMVEGLGVGWINYLHPEGRTPTLGDFKRRVGFRPMRVPASRVPVTAETE